jgi:hypothetical protein
MNVKVSLVVLLHHLRSLDFFLPHFLLIQSEFFHKWHQMNVKVCLVGFNFITFDLWTFFFLIFWLFKVCIFTRGITWMWMFVLRFYFITYDLWIWLTDFI